MSLKEKDKNDAEYFHLDFFFFTFSIAKNV